MSSYLSALMGVTVACLVEYAVGTERTSPENHQKFAGSFSAEAKQRTAGYKKTRSARSVFKRSTSEGERGLSGEGIRGGDTPTIYPYRSQIPLWISRRLPIIREDASFQTRRTCPPTCFSRRMGTAFDMLARFIDHEYVDPADMWMRGIAASLGIVKGKPSRPTPACAQRLTGPRVLPSA